MLRKYISNVVFRLLEMNNELKILKIMKREGLNWVEAEKKQKQIKTLKEFI